MFNRLVFLLSSIFLSLSFVSHGSYHEPYDLPRIYWDINSQQVIFPTGNYARLIPLQDGRLMAVAEAGGGISCCYSQNNGQTWSSPELIIRNADKLPFSVPDVIQLSDGTIIVGYNPRPSRPYSEDRHFGIRVIRSTDNGKTWEQPVFVYDAKSVFEDGCWEPSFLELPDGEIHLYFANENNFVNSNDQEISMCRSFDQGKTWSEPVRICYRQGSRDGMPSAIITDNGEIVVIIEDNGWPGYGGFRATTVRSSLNSNWESWIDSYSDQRNMIFADQSEKNSISAAPYLRKLPSGETIASWQGNKGGRINGEDGYDMFVAVGDKDAKNFRYVTEPFGLDLQKHALWNSIGVGNEGDVYAVASIGNKGQSNAINIIKGYPKKGFTANFGTPQVDGSFSGENWTYKNAQQVYMGTTTRRKSTMDFLYDKENLYFYARVIDRDIFTDEIDNDGVTLALDLENCCDTYPQKGMFRFFFNVNGETEFYEGSDGKWNKIDKDTEIEYICKLSNNYYDMEVAIPWNILGYKNPPVDNQMRCYLEVKDRRENEIISEVIPESNLRQSWTWPEFNLNPEGYNGITEIIKETQEETEIIVYVKNGNVLVESSRDIAKISVISVNGLYAREKNGSGKMINLDIHELNGIYILQVTDIDNRHYFSKISI